MISFFKYHSIGNSFIIIKKSDFVLNENFVKTICNPNFGIGADGLIIYFKKNNDIFWKFFNCDGSVANMCGNGARCFAAFLYEEKLKTKNFSFYPFDNFKVACDVLKIKDSIFDVMVKFKLKREIFKKDGFVIVNSGVKHLLLPISKKRVELASKLEKKYDLNVTFFEINHSKKSVEIATYERGLKRFSFGCGTAAAAVTLFCNLDEFFEFNFNGGKLYCKYEKEHIFLKSKVVLIAKGEYYEQN